MSQADPKLERLKQELRQFVERRARGEPLTPQRFMAERGYRDPALTELLTRAQGWAATELDQELATLSLTTPKGAQAPGEQPTSISAPAGGAETIDGRYGIVRELGRGGFGVVHLVEDLLHGGLRRALKMVLPLHARNPEFEKRFRNEIAAMRGLAHEGIPQIFNDGRTGDGSFYYTMAYVEGRSLADVLKESGPLPPERIVRIVRQMIAILEYAHGRGIVHRDLKPSNVLLVGAGGESERVRVLDFGIAKILEGQGEVEGALTMNTLGGMGTPHYMSPEQVRGKDVDGRTDIYALGIIIYQMCSGLLPFSGTSHQEIATARLEQPPKPLEPDRAPEWLREFVMSLLERERERRPDTQQVLARLEGLERSQREVSRGLRWAIAVAVVLALLVALAIVPKWGSGASSKAASGKGDQASGPLPPPDAGPEPTPSPVDDGPQPCAASSSSITVPGAELAAGGRSLGTLYVKALPATIPLELGAAGATASVRLDGREHASDAEGRVEIALDSSAVPASGERELTLEVVDGSGGARSFGLVLVVDGLGPRLTATPKVADGLSLVAKGKASHWTTAESVDLALAVEEEHPEGALAFRLREDTQREPLDAEPTVIEGAYAWRGVRLASGTNGFLFVARDKAGNATELQVAIKRAVTTNWETEAALLHPGERSVRWSGAADGDLASIELRGLPKDVKIVEQALAADDPRRFEIELALPPEGTTFEGSLFALDPEGDPARELAVHIERGPPLVPAGCRRAKESSVDPSGWIDRVVHDRSGIDLVLVPPAGSAGAPSATAPFYIGERELTWGQFLAWRREETFELRRDFLVDSYELHSAEALDPYPVVQVSFEEARSWCAELGLRLPMGPEWDRALHGDGHVALPKPGRIRAQSSAPVGTYPEDRSWCGALDLAGNVSEWCQPAEAGARPLLGGGSWMNEPEAISWEAIAPRVLPARGNETIGFRVALSVP